MAQTSQRQFERYVLTATAAIRGPEVSGVVHTLLLTRDISAGGAFFNTRESALYRGPVMIEVLLELSNEFDRVNYTHMTVSGDVVRHEEAGVAVRFHDDAELHHFMSVDKNKPVTHMLERAMNSLEESHFRGRTS